jgi:hypothetical protein
VQQLAKELAALLLSARRCEITQRALISVALNTIIVQFLFFGADYHFAKKSSLEALGGYFWWL